MSNTRGGVYGVTPPGPHGSPSPGKHVAIKTWLERLGLQEYKKLFKKYKGVEELVSLTEADLRDLGVKNSAHRARMASNLVMLREHRLGRKVKRNVHPYESTPPSSANTTPPSSMNHPDYAPVQSSFHSAAGGLSKRDVEVMTELGHYTWYHGTIPRQTAELLCVRDGDFLLRDSTTQVGDFVLTCRWRDSWLHFLVNRVNTNDSGGYSRVQYQFEGGMFASVPDLIHHYLDGRQPISGSSGAVIGFPITRNRAAEYSAPRGDYNSPRVSSLVSPVSSPRASPQLNRRSRPTRAGSQPLLSMDDDDGRSGSPSRSSQIGRHGSLPFIGNMSFGESNVQIVNIGGTEGMQRTGSAPLLSPTEAEPKFGFGDIGGMQGLTGSEGELYRSPPPKPTRVPTMVKRGSARPAVVVRNKEFYEDDGKDYSDYAQVKSWPSYLRRTEDNQGSHKDILRKSDVKSTIDPNRNAQLIIYDAPKHATDNDGCDVIPSRLPKITLPELNPSSHFDVQNYDSDLLTPNNKPLEGSAVATIKELLLNCDTKLLAYHITYVDLDILKVNSKCNDLGLGVFSGLELITLPQGEQMRKDLIERHESLKTFVGVTVLMSPRTAERARVIHTWIQIALQLRGTMGNLFSFSAIMAALLLPQVTRLTETWATLHCAHTDSALVCEGRLRHLYRCLQEASGSLPLQNITVPHIMPLLQLLQRDLPQHLDRLETWEEGNADSGIDILLAHLDTARIITEQCRLYSDTSSALMKGFVAESGLLELCQTQTHLRFLWGARGALVSPSDRYAKFEQVLNALSQKAESSQATERESSV